jgi:hypothetical protein
MVITDGKLEFHRPAADARRARVQFVDRHACAVEIVPAVMRLRTGERRGKTDFDDLRRLRLC